jgi:Kef-type K+ transport system membrane component KefB
MKLIDASILSIALALCIVGIHQTLVNGIGFSYSIFMFAAGLLFWFQLRRNKAQEEIKKSPQAPKKGGKSHKNR